MDFHDFLWLNIFKRRVVVIGSLIPRFPASGLTVVINFTPASLIIKTENQVLARCKTHYLAGYCN